MSVELRVDLPKLYQKLCSKCKKKMRKACKLNLADEAILSILEKPVKKED